MTRARKKAPKQDAPQTIEEATALAARYIELLDIIDMHQVDAQKSIDMIVAVRDQVVKAIEDEAKAIFRQLRPWWASNKADLTGGKRKSIELAGALIGERTGTPALGLPKGTTLGRFVEWLVSRDLFALIRTKHSVDKQACIQALRELDKPAPDLGASDGEVIAHRLTRALGEQLAEKGATITQKDEFFIDRAGAPAEGAEQVEVESEGAGA